MNGRTDCDGLITPVEVLQLRKHHTVAPSAFVCEMMRLYGCKIEAGSVGRFAFFLIDIFWAGWVAGIRHERARRKKG